MRQTLLCVSLLLISSYSALAAAPDGNRLAYLDESDPYYVGRGFPKLVTPQWVGEEGVEAVVVLAIDDMRGPAKWEAYLRPILARLKQIDGRAPVSIMTCQIDPADAHLQTWLKEGLSLECHTYDHPCPILKDGDLAKAKGTYDRCIDLLAQVPGNRPVAFRVPCCDSLNTPSPRLYAEIFNRTTPAGNYLQIDSSVFNVFTSDDPELPRESVLDADGRERFKRYVPYDRSFVNTIENYPYPYVIGRLGWQFPCVAPSDWSAQHLQKPNNPKTVEDLKAALDCVVAKQGVYNLVFHPHGWIRNDQVNELIDHAVMKHGRKVKFLTFHEALERLNKHFLGGHPLRDEKGQFNGVCVLDVNHDGYMDVVVGNPQAQSTRVWSPKSRSRVGVDFPVRLVEAAPPAARETGVRFGVFEPSANAGFFVQDPKWQGLWLFRDMAWQQVASRTSWLPLGGDSSTAKSSSPRLRLRDLNADGLCELLASDGATQRLYSVDPDAYFARGLQSISPPVWKELNLRLPDHVQLRDSQGRDAGLRFIDLDDDGHDDLLFSNHERYSIHLFDPATKAWSRQILSGQRGEKEPAVELPPIVRADGSNNGFWAHTRHLWWQNEDTARMKDLVDRRSFDDLLKGVQPGPKSPEAALKSMYPRPGFTVELVAAEPLVMDPIAFAWGADGKFWVVEMADYPLGIDGQGKHGGRVRYLEDTNGDGRYDKSTLFLDGLGYPSGVWPWRKGVLISCAPEILYAEDTDGDGRADRRETLYQGFSEGNQQHRVNGFSYGLDNWLYGANGDSGGKIKSLKTGEEVSISGRDFRIRPDAGRIEAQAGQSQFGRHRDDWGNWFGNNNSNPMWHYALEDHYLRRNPHVAPPDGRVMVSQVPGAAPVYPRSRTLERFNDFNKANRFTSACSAIIYRDDLLGSEYVGNSFVSEPVHNLVHREVVEPKGTTFTSRRAGDEAESEFLASSDNWFRPAMVQTGPDGAIWVADMYRHVIEHPQWIPPDWQKRLDLRAGHDKGRIYRLYPKDRAPRAIPRLDKLTTQELVGALDSPSGWQRDMAQQLLIEQQDKSAVPHLQRLAQQSTRPQARLHALCTLDGLNALNETALMIGMGDSHPGVRRHAVRLAEPLLSASLPLQQVLMAKMVGDTDPQVAMQVAYSLGSCSDVRSAIVLSSILLRPQLDRFQRAAAYSSLNEKNLAEVLAAVIDAQLAEPPVDLLKTLLGLAASYKNEPALIRGLDLIATPRNGKYAAWQVAALTGLLDSLDRDKLSLDKLGQKSGGKLGAALTRVAALFEYSRTTVAQSDAPESERLLAAWLVGRGPDRRQEDLQSLGKLLTPQTSGALQAAVVDALGRIDDKQTPAVLLSNWKAHGPQLRGRILDVLAARPAGQQALVDALKRGDVKAADIDAARRQQLLARLKGDLRSQAEALLAGSVDGNRREVIEGYQSALTLSGNLEQGTAVFKKSCAACHKLGEVGHAVGPDLTALSDRSPVAMLTHVLDPNRAVEAKFLSYTLITTDGRTFNGMLASETSTSVTLLAQENKQHVVLRSEIDELAASGKSLMPDGVEKDLSPQSMADLFAYLATLGPPRKQFAGNKPEVVEPFNDGSLRLFATQCEIFGRTVVFEEKYRNLGYWQSENDQAVWTMNVTQPGRYAVTLDYACDDGSAGNAFQVELGSQRLSSQITGTGSWDNYRRLKVGDLDLTAGIHRLTFRSQGPVRGALIDLRDVKLAPAEK